MSAGDYIKDITFRRNTIDKSLYYKLMGFAGHVNSLPWRGYPPGRWLCADPTVIKVWEPWAVACLFTYIKHGWNYVPVPSEEGLKFTYVEIYPVKDFNELGIKEEELLIYDPA